MPLELKSPIIQSTENVQKTPVAVELPEVKVPVMQSLDISNESDDSEEIVSITPRAIVPPIEVYAPVEVTESTPVEPVQNDPVVETVDTSITLEQNSHDETILPGIDEIPVFVPDESTKSSVTEDIPEVSPELIPGFEASAVEELSAPEVEHPVIPVMDVTTVGIPAAAEPPRIPEPQPLPKEEVCTVLDEDEIDADLFEELERKVALNAVSADVPEQKEDLAPMVDVEDDEPLVSASDEEDFDSLTEEGIRQKIISEQNELIPSWTESITEGDDETVIILHDDKEFLADQFSAIAPNRKLDGDERTLVKLQAVNSPTTFPSTLINGIKFDTTEYRARKEGFSKLSKELGRVSSVGQKKISDAFSGKKTLKLPENSTILSGRAAVETVLSIISGIRLVRLYNSGFHVKIRPPKRSELNEYFLRCRTTQYEYGRKFGELFYTPADVELKVAFMDLFEKLVTGSNLENWEIPGQLRKNISIHDLATCMWGVTSLMYPDGASTKFLCNHKDCGKVDRAIVDIAKMRFNDYSRINPEALLFVGSSETRTEEDLRNYHTNILKDTSVIKIGDSFAVDVHVPSVDTVIESGNVYVADLASKLSLKMMSDVSSMVKNKYYRIFAPWISKVTYTQNSTGKMIHIADPLAIPEVVDSLQIIDGQLKLQSAMEECIERKKISHFGYTYSTCPHCGRPATSAVNGIIPCDVAYTFFIRTMDFLA